MREKGKTEFRIRPYGRDSLGRTLWGLQRNRGRKAPNAFLAVSTRIEYLFQKILRIHRARTPRRKPFYPEH